MKIIEVTFDCTIAMPGYNNVKPGIGRVILEEGETPEQAWTELNHRAQAWHKKEYPHLYQEEKQYTSFDTPGEMTEYRKKLEQVMPFTPPAVLNIEEERKEVMDTIDKCATLEDLKAWKSQNQTVPGKILTHYNKKLEELSK